jgi:hypothetical protein
MLRNLSHPHIWSEGVPALCATDEAWQDAVRFLAVRARALILLVDETASQGLRWEIDLIVSLGLQAKTIALIPDTMSPDVVETLSQLGLPRPHHVRCLRGSDPDFRTFRPQLRPSFKQINNLREPGTTFFDPRLSARGRRTSTVARQASSTLGVSSRVRPKAL